MVECVHRHLVVQPPSECRGVEWFTTPLGRIGATSNFSPECGDDLRLLSLRDEHGEKFLDKRAETPAAQRPSERGLPARVAATVRAVDSSTSNLLAAIEDAPVGISGGELGVVHRSAARLSHLDDLEGALALEEPSEPRDVCYAAAHVMPIVSELA